MSVYPEDFDRVWIALDAQGRVAAFVTAGEGPVPEAVLGSDVDITDIEGLLLDMAETGEAQLLASRVSRPLTDRYQCMARPTVVLMADTLPEALRAAAMALPASDFAREVAIAPHDQLLCLRGGFG